MQLGGSNAAARLIDLIADAGHAGVDLVQVREGDLPDRALAELVTDAVEATRGTDTRIVVNDRIDVALAAGAAGVHLKSDSVPANRARTMTPASWVLGRSVHGVAEAVDPSLTGGLDYLIFGTVFETASKPGACATGLGLLDQVASAAPVPVLAIGGLTVARACDAGRHHAAGIAAIRLFAEAWRHDKRRGLTELVAELRRAFDSGGTLV